MTGRSRLSERLKLAHESGRKLLIPYVTAGMRPDWVEVVEAIGVAGADAVEIGIPFSDPMIDGPTIQQASAQALEAGTTPTKVLDALRREDTGTPLAVMTYYNLVYRAGHDRFADSLVEAGVSGAILPDLPLEEAGGWCQEADRAGVDTVMLVAPTTPDDRAARICARSRGFVYAVGVMGVTGERPQLAESAGQLARRLRTMTDLPVCIGIGVSTPEQARQACEEADGIAVGSALVRRLLEGASPEAAAHFVSQLRSAIDDSPAANL